VSLSLKAYEPLSEQGLYSRQFVEDLTNNHEGGQFIISAVGGFDTSSFTIKGIKSELDDWYEDGLMRRISWENPEGIQVWEGYVHSIEYQTGKQRKSKSIENYLNRIYMDYAPLDTSVSPPLELSPIVLIVDDLVGQIKYGVKSQVISGGGRADDTAYDWARTILKNQKKVPVGRTVSTQGGGPSSISIEAKGYYHTLKWLPYIKAATGKIQAHQVIQEVLQYFHAINPWLSLDFGWMDYSSRRARRGYDELLSCWQVIEDIIREGGQGGERWVGGFYQDRQFIYKPAEDISGLYAQGFELYQALEDPGQFIYDSALGSEVKPWDMTPDQVLHTVDSNVGGERDLMYIEQTTFSEPYGLDLVGEDDQRLKVFLAQRGLPG
jgi:hypothetical protein